MIQNSTLIKNMEKAHVAIEQSFCKVSETDNALRKEYNGYVASFGTTLRQLGLLPALLNYFEANECTKPVVNKASGHHLISALALMAGAKDAQSYVEIVFKTFKESEGKEVEEREEIKKLKKEEMKKLEKEAIEHSIALKKTLRLFRIQS